MNSAIIYQDQIEQMDLYERAEVLRSQGAPIPHEDYAFPESYTVMVTICQKRQPGKFSRIYYKYEWFGMPMMSLTRY